LLSTDSVFGFGFWPARWRFLDSHDMGVGRGEGVKGSLKEYRPMSELPVWEMSATGNLVWWAMNGIKVFLHYLVLVKTDIY
ncbi:MAG: hypothetical protein ABEJ58_10920, partial [Halodesulfurarchaeum sp.]